jgi:hypothetical protein
MLYNGGKNITKNIVYLITFYILIFNPLITLAQKCDAFEEGIPQDWTVVGQWRTDDQNKIIGKNSIESDLFNDDSTTSFSKNVLGPCKIKFKWRILGGKDSWILYDNGNPTGCYLPNDLNIYNLHANDLHPNVEWKDAIYNISDCSEHEIKLVHEEYGSWGITCSAWIDGMNITTYESPIRFKDAMVLPLQGSSQQEKDVDSLMIVPFNYSVNVETDLPLANVELFTISPGINTKAISRGVKKVSSGEKKLFWDVVLNSSDCGKGTFWFVANSNFNSYKYSGPDIVNFIYETNFSIRNNPKSMCSCLSLNTRVSGEAALLYSYNNSDNRITWKGYNNTEPFIKGQNQLCWDNIFIKPFPEYWKFLVS